MFNLYIVSQSTEREQCSGFSVPLTSALHGGGGTVLVVNTTHRSLHPLRMTRYPLYRRLGGLQGCSGLHGMPGHHRDPISALSVRSDYAISTHILNQFNNNMWFLSVIYHFYMFLTTAYNKINMLHIRQSVLSKQYHLLINTYAPHYVLQITYPFPLRRVSLSTDTIFRKFSLTVNSSQRIKC